MGNDFAARRESYVETWDEPYALVSLCSLITDPDSFDKENVRLIGVIDWEAEGDKVCLHKEDLKYGLLQNCLSVEIDSKQREATYESLFKMNKDYVVMDGVFDKDGFGGVFAGSIRGVRQIRGWGSAESWRLRLHYK